MKILVFSDTHGDITKCTEVIDSSEKVDVIIHLGDVKRDAKALAFMYPKIEIHAICGNNDFGNSYSELLELGGKKIFICHGHLFGVKRGYDRLVEHGLKVEADIVLFGHTHESYQTEIYGITLLNPGSANTRSFSKPTYGIIEIEEDGRVYARIHG